MFKIDTKSKRVAWRVLFALLGVAVALTWFAVVPNPAHASPMREQAHSYAHRQVHRFEHHRLGRSPRIPKKIAHALDRAWNRQHPHSKDGDHWWDHWAHKAVADISCAYWDTQCTTPGWGGAATQDAKDTLTAMVQDDAYITFGCGGGSAFAALRPDEPYFDWWTFGTGTAGCTWSVLYMQTHGH